MYSDTSTVTPAADPVVPHAPVDRRLAVGLGALGVAAIASRAAAGPLNPPAGPVAPTGKPLAELEPRTAINSVNTPGVGAAVYTITQPGSYYLTGDVMVPTNKIGIHIATDDVWIDLCGFRVFSSGALANAGITSESSLKNISIRNGTIEGVAGNGVAYSGDVGRFSDLIIRNCGSIGLVKRSPIALLERVVATGCSATAIEVGTASAIFDCHADSNLSTGIEVSAAHGLFSGCSATRNGAFGLMAGDNALFVDCISFDNDQHGIVLNQSGVAHRCISTNNGGTGFHAQNLVSVLTDCNAQGNAAGGFIVGEGSVIAGCIAEFNGSDGFSLAHGCSLSGSTADANARYGVNASAATGASISGCVVRGSGSSGIIAGSRSSIRNNNCASNGQPVSNTAGIQISGSSNRVQGNICSAGGYGVWVTAQHNLILRNATSQNTINWNFDLNCIYGTVINRTSPAASGMSGNGTAPSTLGTTDPFANVSY